MSRARGDVGGNVHLVLVSRSESRSFSSVIIFMYRQIARSETASKRLSGASLARRCRIPVSVATRKRPFGECLREADHPLGREDVRALVSERHALARAAALGMHEQLGVGRVGLPALDVVRPDAGVDVALAHPDRQLAAGDPLDPDPEEQVRQEEDLGSSGIASTTAFALPDVQQ